MKCSSFFFFLLLAQEAAWGYVLPPSYMLDQWLGKFKGVRTLQIVSQTTLFTSRGHTESAREEIWIKRPNLFRKTSTTATTKIHCLALSDRAIRVVAGRIEAESLALCLGPLGVLYRPNDRLKLRTLLQEIGVDVGQYRWVVSASRDVLWEMGSMGQTRLDFQKETIVPVQADFGKNTYRFEFGKPQFPVSYPSLVEVLSDGQLIQKIEPIEVHSNVNLRDTLFDANRLLSEVGKQ